MKFNDIKKVFEEAADPQEAIGMKHYMRDQFEYYGIRSTVRKEISKPFYKAAKSEGKIDWKLLDKCYEDPHRELQYFANGYLKAMSKHLTYDDIDKLLEYAQTKSWWDTIDFLDTLIGNIGLEDKRVDHLMIKLSTDDDFWLRRIAIDHQRGRKDKTNTKLLSLIIKNNFGSKEFFINKAIGWALRDFSKTDSNWVRDFIEKNKDKMANLSIREASKYI